MTGCDGSTVITALVGLLVALVPVCNALAAYLVVRARRKDTNGA